VINELLMRYQRPERGWDPVDRAYASEYAALEWQHPFSESVDWLESARGKLAGKRVLDLGAGGGQYSAEFARRGADVTWFDVSAAYYELARRRFVSENLNISMCVGYMDEADVLLGRKFDVVWNRVCWYYCANDFGFAKTIVNLLDDDGEVCVITPTAPMQSGSLSSRFRSLINARTGIKIGHPYPPAGRVQKALERAGLKYAGTEMLHDHTERVIAKKQ
jgi:2-polyprenyl-3-methyl-5-hydroxy-6-metoxy-1,4-benzoquinol methylase